MKNVANGFVTSFALSLFLILGIGVRAQEGQPSSPMDAQGAKDVSSSRELPNAKAPGAAAPAPVREEAIPDSIKNFDPYVNKIDVLRYRLAPGDQVRIDISGTLPDSQKCLIDSAGYIFLLPVGKIRVANLTLLRAQEKLNRDLSLYLKHAQAGITLLSLRRFPVEISGEVKAPGIYQVTALTSINDLLERAGGFTKVAAKRNVTVLDIRSREKISTVDLIKYNQVGDLSQNISLRPFEAIFVPPTALQVYLIGEVAKPGPYELLPGDTLGSLISLAGGASSRADTSAIQIGRLNASGQRELIRASMSEGGRFKLEQDDRIEIFDKSLNAARVRVIGELESPLIVAPKPHDNAGQIYSDFPKQGSVFVREGQTIRELVLSLGGPTAKADVKNSWLERVDSKGIKTFYPINLDTLLHDYNPSDTSSDLTLRNGDVLVVPPVSDSVFVVGQVTKSGPQPWTPGLGIRDYLGLAGGPNSDASTKHARLIRRVPGKQPLVYEFDALRVLEGGWDPALEVRAGDVVFIPHFQTFYKDTLNVLSQISPLYLFVK